MKKRMTKIIALGLTGILFLFAGGCSGSSESIDEENVVSEVEEAETEAEEISNDEEAASDEESEEVDPELKEALDIFEEHRNAMIGIATIYDKYVGTNNEVSSEDTEKAQEYMSIVTQDKIDDSLEYLNKCYSSLNELSKTDLIYFLETITRVNDKYGQFVSSILNEDANKHTEEQTESSTETQDSTTSGIDPEFKAAMDSYEAFFDEYCAFMEKYSESDDATSMLTDYANYMTKYAETMEVLDAIDENNLNEEELAYYLEVMARINEKLAAVGS